MIDPKCLEHRPEPVTQVDGKRNKGHDIKARYPGRTEELLNPHPNSFMIAKRYGSGMDQHKKEDEEAAIGHAARCLGVFGRTVLDLVVMNPGSAVLEKEHGSGDGMDEKDKHQGLTDEEDNQRMAMELSGIGLKERHRGKERCISSCMAAKEEEQEASGAGHNPFFADGRCEELYEPHSIEPLLG